jgi:hypothetical protein
MPTVFQLFQLRYSSVGFSGVAHIEGAYWNIKEKSIRAARFSRVRPVSSAR